MDESERKKKVISLIEEAMRVALKDDSLTVTPDKNINYLSYKCEEGIFNQSIWGDSPLAIIVDMAKIAKAIMTGDTSSYEVKDEE